MSRVIEVRQDQGGVVVALRPYARWQDLAIPAAMLVALFVVSSVSAPHSLQERAISALIALGSGLALGSIAYGLAQLLVGREEKVAISGGQLLIDRQVWRRPELRRRRTFEIGRVVNLRAVGPARPYQPRGAFLAFDYDGSTVTFGLGVAGADADRVVKALATAVPAWTDGEPARPATAAPGARSRSWSRVTLLVTVLSMACLAEVALTWPLDPTKMTLPLAVAIMGAGFIPMWAFIVLNLESRAFWRARVWVRLGVGLGVGVPGLLVPMQVMLWASAELLSPFRAVDKADLRAIWLVHMLLVIAGISWMTLRAERLGWRPRDERGVERMTGGR